MKKIIAIALLASLAACNQARSLTKGETTTCSYNLENNQKTCEMTNGERQKLIENTVKAVDPVMVIDGTSYRKQPDGSLKPIN